MTTEQRPFADEDHVIGLKAPDEVTKWALSTVPLFPPETPLSKFRSEAVGLPQKKVLLRGSTLYWLNLLYQKVKTSFFLLSPNNLHVVAALFTVQSYFSSSILSECSNKSKCDCNH